MGFSQCPGLLWGHNESLGPAVCPLLFQLHDGQDEAAALLIQPGRGRSGIFDALQEIFGQDSLTIISQKFHNERAIYLAKSSGISAVGYNARDVARRAKYIKIHGREYLARVKMFLDLLTDKQPRFLGKKEETPF